MGRPVATVVVPTHNRPAGLLACVSAIAAGDPGPQIELVVVDDGSETPAELPAGLWPGPHRVVRLGGLGPSQARNAGVQHARGDVVLFTDDDTLPEPGWVRAAVDHLTHHPGHIGVEGVVRSLPWDPLYAYSIQAERPGHYWTCNIAYRRDALLELGGFRAGVYPSAHAEDRDLGLRASARAPIGFSEKMVIVHTPRSMRPEDFRRQAKSIRSDLVLDALTRDERHRSGLLGEPRLYAMTWSARNWGRRLRDPRAAVLRSPARLARFVRIAIPALLTSCWYAARTPNAARLRLQFGAEHPPLPSLVGGRRER